MNKIPNKIMDAEKSNTPRTEANLHGEFPYLVDADFARQLERELNSTKKEVSDWVFNANELQKGYNKLDKEVIELNESLKEAHEIISHFGWTSSDSTEVILKAERWLAAQPEKKK